MSLLSSRAWQHPTAGRINASNSPTQSLLESIPQTLSVDIPASAPNSSSITPVKKNSSTTHRHRHRHRRRVSDEQHSVRSNELNPFPYLDAEGITLEDDKNKNNCSDYEGEIQDSSPFGSVFSSDAKQILGDNRASTNVGQRSLLEESGDQRLGDLRRSEGGGVRETSFNTMNESSSFAYTSPKVGIKNKGMHPQSELPAYDASDEGLVKQYVKKKSNGSSSSQGTDRHVSSMKVLLAEQALIGKGSSGKVFRAMDRKTNRLIAVKEIPIKNLPATTRDEINLQKRNSSIILLQENSAHAELETLRKLDHPNIVKFLGEETDIEAGCIRIYMDLVSGGSIRSLLLTYGKFDEEQAASYTKQVLEGLVYLHSRGIVHRDLKGDNLLVEPSGILKLADFGTAGMVSAENPKQEINGTAFFMSPEVLTNENNITEKADIWSLGCCVIEMMVGKPPLAHLQGQYAVMMMIAESTGELIKEYIPAESKDWSPELLDFLAQCLHRNPKERPSATDLLSHPWIKQKANEASLNASTRGLSSLHERKEVETLEIQFSDTQRPQTSEENCANVKATQESSEPQHEVVPTHRHEPPQHSRTTAKNVYERDIDEVVQTGKNLVTESATFSRSPKAQRQHKSENTWHDKRQEASPALPSPYRKQMKFSMREYHTHAHYRAEMFRDKKNRRNQSPYGTDSSFLPPLRSRRHDQHPLYDGDVETRPCSVMHSSLKHDYGEGPVPRGKFLDHCDESYPSTLRGHKPGLDGTTRNNGGRKGNTLKRNEVYSKERRGRDALSLRNENRRASGAFLHPVQQRKRTSRRNRGTDPVVDRQNPLELFKADPHHINHVFPRWTDEAQREPRNRVLQPYIRLPNDAKSNRFSGNDFRQKTSTPFSVNN